MNHLRHHLAGLRPGRCHAAVYFETSTGSHRFILPVLAEPIDIPVMGQCHGVPVPQPMMHSLVFGWMIPGSTRV
jgi:hypothetical protein